MPQTDDRFHITQQGPAKIAGQAAYYFYFVSTMPQRAISVYGVMVFMAVGRMGFFAFGGTPNDPARVQTDYTTISRILETFRPQGSAVARALRGSPPWRDGEVAATARLAGRGSRRRGREPWDGVCPRGPRRGDASPRYPVRIALTSAERSGAPAARRGAVWRCAKARRRPRGRQGGGSIGA